MNAFGMGGNRIGKLLRLSRKLYRYAVQLRDVLLSSYDRYRNVCRSPKGVDWIFLLRCRVAEMVSMSKGSCGQ